MRERDLTNAGSDQENEREGRGSGGEEGGEERRRRRKIEEDHEDGCIGRDAGDAGGEEKSYVEAEARTAEVKRNVNGRKSGEHRWMKKQKDIDDGG